MLKLLYVGVYRDGGGYSSMAINTMMALIAAGVDVTARPVKLNKANGKIPPEILEAERKKGGGFDVVIQNLLPHDYDYCGKIPLNIGYYCTETSRFDGIDWPAHINTLDRAWVCNQQSLQASKNSGVVIPTDVIPIACDVRHYQRKYKPLLVRERLADSFIFYYIGDFNKRKNLTVLIKAFHLEFDVTEPVNLVLKTNVGSGEGFLDDYENMKTREAVILEIDKVKEAMSLYRSPDQYKKEIVLVGQYSEEEIMRLHASCDCFVCPSFGEAWCLPCMDAMALGRTPIVPRHTGFVEYMNDETGWLVDHVAEPVWGLNNGLSSSREEWLAVDVYHLMKCMREAYENKGLRQDKANFGKRRAYDFSYEKVGLLMKRNLES
jgi:glycosyltransferase involved in cell wall biosynthesis